MKVLHPHHTQKRERVGELPHQQVEIDVLEEVVDLLREDTENTLLLDIDIQLGEDPDLVHPCEVCAPDPRLPVTDLVLWTVIGQKERHHRHQHVEPRHVILHPHEMKEVTILVLKKSDVVTMMRKDSV